MFDLQEWRLPKCTVSVKFVISLHFLRKNYLFVAKYMNNFIREDKREQPWDPSFAICHLPIALQGQAIIAAKGFITEHSSN